MGKIAEEYMNEIEEIFGKIYRTNIDKTISSNIESLFEKKSQELMTNVNGALDPIKNNFEKNANLRNEIIGELRNCKNEVIDKIDTSFDTLRKLSRHAIEKNNQTLNNLQTDFQNYQNEKVSAITKLLHEQNCRADETFSKLNNEINSSKDLIKILSKSIIDLKSQQIDKFSHSFKIQIVLIITNVIFISVFIVMFFR